MIICNGCSKSGTHILTNIAKTAGLKQVGGTLVMRKPNAKAMLKGATELNTALEYGNDRFVHAHIAHSEKAVEMLQNHKHLYIYRHPRNIAFSWLRHRNKEDSSIAITKENLIRLIKGGMFGSSIPDFYAGFLNWMIEPNVFVVSFEEITSEDYSFDPIEGFLGLSKGTVDRSIFESSSTKNKIHSNWQDIWDDEVECAWRDAGGNEVEERYNKLKSTVSSF